MDDALILITQTEVGEPKLLDIFLERDTLDPAVLLLYKIGDTLEVLSGCGWYIVVGCGKCAIGSADFAGSVLETFKCLWRGHLMDKMSIYVLLMKKQGLPPAVSYQYRAGLCRPVCRRRCDLERPCRIMSEVSGLLTACCESDLQHDEMCAV